MIIARTVFALSLLLTATAGRMSSAADADLDQAAGNLPSGFGGPMPADGLWVGSVVPDPNQELQGNCWRGSTPIEVLMRDGRAFMSFGGIYTSGHYERATGFVKLEGHERSLTLFINQGTTDTYLRGRALAGQGPWCRYYVVTFRLRSFPPTVARLAGRLDGTYRASAPPVCAPDEMQYSYIRANTNLSIHEGVAFAKIRGRTAYGFVGPDTDNIKLSGWGLTVDLTRTSSGYHALINDAGTPRQANRSWTWVANTPCRLELDYSR